MIEERFDTEFTKEHRVDGAGHKDVARRGLLVDEWELDGVLDAVAFFDGVNGVGWDVL